MKKIILTLFFPIAFSAQAGLPNQIRVKPGMIRSVSIVSDEQCSKVYKDDKFHYPYYEVGMTATLVVALTNGVTLRQPFSKLDMYSTAAPDAATAFEKRTCPNVISATVEQARKASFDTWLPIKHADLRMPAYDAKIGQCFVPILDVDYEADGRINLMRAGQVTVRCP